MISYQDKPPMNHRVPADDAKFPTVKVQWERNKENQTQPGSERLPTWALCSNVLKRDELFSFLEVDLEFVVHTKRTNGTRSCILILHGLENFYSWAELQNSQWNSWCSDFLQLYLILWYWELRKGGSHFSFESAYLVKWNYFMILLDSLYFTDYALDGLK